MIQIYYPPATVLPRKPAETPLGYALRLLHWRRSRRLDGQDVPWTAEQCHAVLSCSGELDERLQELEDAVLSCSGELDERLQELEDLGLNLDGVGNVREEIFDCLRAAGEFYHVQAPAHPKEVPHGQGQNRTAGET
jgi:hypothetical protein